MNRKITFAVGEFYHVYNRGNDKRVIFMDDLDRKRFIWLLFLCNGTMKLDMRSLKKRINKGVTFVDFMEERGNSLVDIGAYCLMPNHFHILLHEKIDGGITLFMRKLCTAYSMYFNVKHNRGGKLFERVFLAEHADSDEHLKYLFSYIHLNPVKLIDSKWRERNNLNSEKIMNFLNNYKFSSYSSYLGETKEGLILNRLAFPEYFLNKRISIKNEIAEWLNFNRKDPTKVTPL